MRKIAVATGTRAEYGLLKPLMDEIKKDGSLELQVVASAMHLSPEFGLTYREIEKDGFKINEKVEMLLSSDTPTGISKSMGLGIIGYAEVLERLKPDLVIILGDRFEALAFAITSYVHRIPIAHLYGGEATLGVIDEGIRHSITKLSYLHFTSTEEYRKRVIQLGEDPDRVYNSGALGLDNIRKMRLLRREELEQELGIQFKDKNLIVTFHPVTLEKNKSEEQFNSLLSALEESVNTFIIFTKANADTGGRIINQMIDEFVKRHKNCSKAFTSMGQLLYLSTMQYVDAVVGNSSSGIIEAPSFRIGTINIGDRQKGRIKAASAIDCKPTKVAIKKAIERLYSKEFKEILKAVENPYGDGRAAERIIKVLKNAELSDIKKEFFDIKTKSE